MLKSKRLFLVVTLIMSIFSSLAVVNADSTFIDKKNLDNGVININYNGDKQVAVKVIKDSVNYDYVLNGNNNIPLQGGNGKYDILLLENIGGTKYKQIAKESVELKLRNQDNVYLQSIQMIYWNENMQAIKKANELTKGLKTDSEKVKVIYDYIVNNIKYDHGKAANPGSNYIPNIDRTLSTKYGICYDYSSLFAAMLRSQGIPTKLVMGYKNDMDEYHAWNQVYIEDLGKWVTIDTTYDAALIKDNLKVNMIKSSSEYRIEKVY